MRQIKYGKDVPGQLYIGRVGNKLLAISIGSRGPFEFIDVFNKAATAYAKNFKEEFIEIYLDLLSCLGNKSNRFAKIIYDKKKGQVDIFSVEEIEKDKLPPEIRKELIKFYKQKVNLILEKSILTNREKQKISQNPL